MMSVKLAISGDGFNVEAGDADVIQQMIVMLRAAGIDITLPGEAEQLVEAVGASGEGWSWRRVLPGLFVLMSHSLEYRASK